MEKRIERKGLRPRDAAYLIGAFWAIAVVVFGVLERIVDPKTFHSVWIGMWWAIETAPSSPPPPAASCHARRGEVS